MSTSNFQCRHDVLPYTFSDDFVIKDYIQLEKSFIAQKRGEFYEKNQEKCINQESNITVPNSEREAGRFYHASNGRFLF